MVRDPGENRVEQLTLFRGRQAAAMQQEDRVGERGPLHERGDVVATKSDLAVARFGDGRAPRLHRYLCP